MMKKIVILCLLLVTFKGFSQIPEKYLTRQIKKVLAKETPFDNPDVWENIMIGEEGSSIGKWYSAGHDKKSYLYVGKVNTCKRGGCNNGFSEEGFESFEYAILFDHENRVSKVLMLSYESSRGFEICSKPWLSQFESYNGEVPLSVGNEIDAISGATISVIAITKDIRIQTKVLMEHLKE